MVPGLVVVDMKLSVSTSYLSRSPTMSLQVEAAVHIYFFQMSAMWLATPRLRLSASFVNLRSAPVPHVVFAMSKTLSCLCYTFPLLFFFIHKFSIFSSSKQKNIDVELNVLIAQYLVRTDFHGSTMLNSSEPKVSM